MQMWALSFAIALCVSVAVAEQCTGPTEVATANHRMARIIVLDINTGHVKVIQQCAQLCLFVTACKAFAFRRMSSECELYRANKINNPFDVIGDNEWTYSDISEWPTSVAGRCHYHKCDDDEMCLPVGTTWKCFKLQVECDIGWMQKSNYCYKIIPHDDVLFDEAVEACSQENAILTDIESAAEQTSLTDLLVSQVPTLWKSNPITDMYDNVRVGGTDRNIEGTWIWETRGNKPFDTLVWKRDQPNNIRNQDCATLEIHLDGEIGTLADNHCETSFRVRGYICKKEPKLKTSGQI